MLQQLAVATLYIMWMDIFSLPYMFMTFFMNNGYFHIRMDIFSLPPSYLSHICIYNELRNAILLFTALDWGHQGAPDYVNRIHAIADSDFIPILASLHLQVSKHLTTVELMTVK